MANAYLCTCQAEKEHCWPTDTDFFKVYFWLYDKALNQDAKSSNENLSSGGNDSVAKFIFFPPNFKSGNFKIKKSLHEQSSISVYSRETFVKCKQQLSRKDRSILA